VTPIAAERCADDRPDLLVLGIEDGDTLWVSAEDGTCEAIRLLGVKAPEIPHDALSDCQNTWAGEASTEPVDCWGPESFTWMKTNLTGATVRLEFDKECQDQYGRTLAYVWRTDADGNEFFVNEEIIRDGQAPVYEDFDDIRWAEVFYAFEAEAQAAGRGFWAQCADQ